VTKPNGVFIIGTPSGHEQVVEAKFISEYSQASSRIVKGWDYFVDVNGFWPFIQQKTAIAYNCEMAFISYVVASPNGTWNVYNNDEFWDKGNIFITAVGPNTRLEMNQPMRRTIYTTAGDTNETTMSYGNSLEFWETEESNSWAVPIVSAKLLKIRDALDCSWWEARYRARITAIRTATTHPNDELWNKFNGFGKIDVAAAIAWSGSVPADPFVNGGNVYTPFV
jgi:hypothetical protein